MARVIWQAPEREQKKKKEGQGKEAGHIAVNAFGHLSVPSIQPTTVACTKGPEFIR